MAGLTDSPFRRLVAGLGGCGLLSSEFISSEALLRNIPAEVDKLRFHDEELPLAIQIYGARVEVMAEAARTVESLGAQVCDINMGCPARKVLRGTAGAALMGDLELARAIIRAVRRSISIPLTVKFRSGLRPPEGSDLELGRICQGEGVDAITLHPRFASQQYGGRADWGRITRLKERLSIPVIGNGDVVVATDARRMLDDTGCDAVMIGRAALTNPWIFGQAADVLVGRAPRQPSPSDRGALIRRHMELLDDRFGGRLLAHKLKVHTRWFTRGLPGGRGLRQVLSRLHDPDQLRAEIEAFVDRFGAPGAVTR